MCGIIYMARPRGGQVASDCCCEMSEYDMMFGNFGADYHGRARLSRTGDGRVYSYIYIYI